MRPTFADEVDALLLAEREPPAYTMGVSCVTCGDEEMRPEPVITTTGAVRWLCPTCRVIVEVRVQ